MKEQKLNILFLSGWYPNRVFPTLGNFVQKHAEAVALKSNVIALNICADSSCEKKLELTETTIKNVKTINVYYKKVTHKIPGIAQFQKTIRTIRAYSQGLKTVRSHYKNIDIIHHNILFPSGLVALYLKRIKHIPFLITEHSTAYLTSKNVSLGYIEKSLSATITKNAEFICPVSDDLKNAMISKGFTGNYEVVYNVVDTKLFKPVTDKAQKAKIGFLHISTLDDDHKNITGMLNVVARLQKLRNDFECYFIGDGDITPHVITARGLGIYNSAAFFDGTKTTTEISELMKNSDCFLMFSNYENLPVVMIEAFACGLPVISSDVGGIKEHLINERGKLVKRNDEEALLIAMNEMIDEIRDNKYNKEDIAAYAADNFSYEKISERFHTLYSRIIKKNV